MKEIDHAFQFLLCLVQKLEGMESEEVLKIRGFHTLADKAAVREVHALLDDERAKRHAKGFAGGPVMDGKSFA